MPIPLASQLPYLLHTNRELGLMLAGRKPLAVFSDGLGCFPEAVVRYLRLFDRHVAAGTLIRRDHIKPAVHDAPSLHIILFALPEEAWRIDAMIELKKGPRWSIDQERREGELLGYANWMNDHFLELISRTN